MLALLLGWKASALANSVTLNNPSASDLQTQLNSGQGNPWIIFLNFTNTIVVTTPLLVTYSNTVVIATTTNNVILSGNNTSQVFAVEPNVNFTLENVIITGGNSIGTNGVNGVAGISGGSTGGAEALAAKAARVLGGALLNLGNTTLINCSLLTNNATGGVGGNGGNGGSGTSFGGNGGNGGPGAGGLGGAVYNMGTLILSNCIVAGNTATGGDGGSGGTNGGGAYAYSGIGGNGALGAGAGLYNAAHAMAMIWNTTFNNNFSHGGTSQAAGGAPDNGNGQTGPASANAEGGGLANSGTNILINCTFFQNGATGGNGGNGGNAVSGPDAGPGGNGGNAYGGGIYNASNAVIAVTNCTFAEGSVFGGTNGVAGTGTFTNGNGAMGSGFGANIANLAGTFKFKNSILAYPTNAHNSYAVTKGITDEGNNLSSDGTPSFTMGNSFTNVDPQLLTLSSNGGYADTMAVLGTSRAINAITDSSAPPFDERGVARDQRQPLGAFEYGTINYIISGQIRPASNAYTNVTINAEGEATYSVQPDTNGNFTFLVQADTYVIVPNRPMASLSAPRA